MTVEDTAAFSHGELYSFSSPLLPSVFQLLGSAALIFPAGNIALTSTHSSEWGAIFTGTRATASALTVEFDFSIQNESGADGDGIVAWFAEVPAFEDLGWDGHQIPLNVPGWGLEFDTYADPEHGDPSSNHAAIVTPAMETLAIAEYIPRLSLGSWYHCELRYHRGSIEVFLENATAGYPRTKVLTCDLANESLFSGFIGFSSSSRNGINEQLIDNVRISLSHTPEILPAEKIIPAHDSARVTLTLSAEDLPGGEYWSTVRITVSDSPSSTIAVPIRLLVEPAPDILASREVDFGRFISGSRSLLYLLIKNAGYQDLSITSIHCGSSCLRPLILACIIRPQESLNLPLEVLAVNKGPITEILTLESNDPDERRVEIALRAYIVVSPSDLISRAISNVSSDSIALRVERLQAFGTRDAMHPNRDSVSFWLAREFTSAGLTEVCLDTFRFMSTLLANVVGSMEGSLGGDEEIIIGAHYDSRGSSMLTAPGADDNASGTAGVIEIARALQSIGYVPKTKLRFIGFTGEEYGLLGSGHYASTAVTSGRRILLMLNFDMIGHRTPGPTNSFAYVIRYKGGETEATLDSSLMRLFTTLRPVVSTVYQDRSDSYSFSSKGFPAVFNCEVSLSPYYHSERDSSVHLDFEYAAEILRSGIALILTLDDVSTSVLSPVASTPTEWSLQQNYPNPFNSSTVIRYQLPVVSDIQLVVYDLLGREVAVLASERKSPGSYEVNLDASGLSSGMYIYRLTAGSFVQTRKMVLVR